MGNLADNRAFQMQDMGAMASLPALALQSTTWYRGAAIGILTAGSNAGYATSTFDGTVPVIFAGVSKQKIVVPTSASVSASEFSRRRQIPLKRDGAVSFNAVTTAGNSATPDATWLWKRVWFVSDNEVSLTPTSGWPIYAGRVIGINGMLGCGSIGSTEVLVAIADAVNQPVPEWSYAAVAASTALSASSTETAFDKNFTIPANTLRAGDVLRVFCQGICTATNSTDTFQHKLYIGGITGTAIFTGTATDVANNDIFTCEAYLTVRTIGASGTIVGYSVGNVVPAAVTTAASVRQILASTAIDTTAAQQVVLSGKWSTTSGSNSARLDVMIIERMHRTIGN